MSNYLNKEACVLRNAYGTDLSSRQRAVELRNQVTAGVVATGRYVLDFGGVRTVSDSFADELIAVLVAEHGEEWFREHVEIAGLSQDVRHSVLLAVSNRLERLQTS